MRWSIRLPEPRAHPAPSPDELVAAAREIEEGGWDAVWVSDHPFPLVTEGRLGHHAWDPFAALTFVAGATERVLLHTNVIVLPYRNPFHTAKSAATVQYLSGGRLALAIGSGYLRPEFAALGADFERREELTREGTEAMQAAWSGAAVRREGAGWSAEGNTMLPAVAPWRLLRGGNSRAAIRHAAQACDGWGPFEVTAENAQQTSTVPLNASEGLAERIELLREEAGAAGRATPEIWLSRQFVDWAGYSRDQAQDEVARLEDLGVGWIAWTLDVDSVEGHRRRLDELHALVR